MELYLIKDRPVSFKHDGKWSPDLKRVSDAFRVTLEPAIPEDDDSRGYCKMITKNSTGIGGSEVDLEWVSFLCLPTSPSDEGTIKILAGAGSDPKPSLFGVLVNFFEVKNLSFHLEMKDLDLKYSCGCITKVNLEANDWTLEDILDSANEQLCFKKVKFPKHGLHRTATMNFMHPPECRMTITVKISQDGLAKVPLPSRIPLTSSDLVIVAANGAEVKCHKSRLIECSDAFEELIESLMKDGTINRLKMPEMSEAGVRGLLSFIYNSDLEAAYEKCDIALELYRAGNKYRMWKLKNKMKTLICSKPPEWFSVNMAVRMILHVEDMEEKEEVFKKMVEVLKWHCKNLPADWLASEELGKLIRNHPQLALMIFFRFS